MILFRCRSCGTSLQAADAEAGERQACPMCKDEYTVPTASEPDATPLQIQATQVGKSTFQIKCPKCGGTHNFRGSSLGGVTKCRNCGFKINLPDTIKQKGCLGILVALFISCLGGLVALGVGLVLLLG